MQSQRFQRGKWLKGIVWIKVSMSKKHQENRSTEKLELEIKSFESKAKEIELFPIGESSGCLSETLTFTCLEATSYSTVANKEGGQASGILRISLHLSKKLEMIIHGVCLLSLCKTEGIPSNFSLPYLHIFKIQ